MSWANYKKQKTDFTQISKKVDEMGGVNKFKDSRFWKPTVDKAGNGSAKIRFLPCPEGEDLPWVQYYEHNFDEDGSYFVELCPTLLGRDCPVCKANGILWKSDTGDKENEKIASKRKRQVRYVSNIIVLRDTEEPENEGKVFLYQYGVKIFEKIKAALKPKDPDLPKIYVFDLFEGADFNLDIKKVKGFRNYDDSKFRETPSALFGGDEPKLKKLYEEQLYKLQPFKEESKFKSYEDLEKKFNEIVNGVKGNVQKKADELFGEDKPPVEEPLKKSSRKPKEEKEVVAKKEPTTEPENSEDEEVTVEENSDTLDWYNKLAE